MADENDELTEKAREAGFQTIDEFVKANLHYLSTEQQELFRRIGEIRSIDGTAPGTDGDARLEPEVDGDG